MNRNILTTKSKDIFKPQRRRAVSGPIVAILIIVVAIAMVGILIGTTTDLIGTASIVDSVDLSKQTLYSTQEFASITVKNSGTTPITEIQAYVLIADANSAAPTATIATGTATTWTDCGIGSEKALISTTAAKNGVTLNPGESVTISGNLWTQGTLTSGNVASAQDLDCSDTSTTPTSNGDITDRTEYIIQVDAKGEGGTNADTISFTTTVRSR